MRVRAWASHHLELQVAATAVFKLGHFKFDFKFVTLNLIYLNVQVVKDQS